MTERVRIDCENLGDFAQEMFLHYDGEWYASGVLDNQFDAYLDDTHEHIGYFNLSTCTGWVDV